jgi:hypothetical protein
MGQSNHAMKSDRLFLFTCLPWLASASAQAQTTTLKLATISFSALSSLVWLFTITASGADAVDFTTLSNKVMTGYQGWHWATGDGSPHNKWNHWITDSTVRPGPGNCHMDMFPDMTEYAKQYDTDFYTPGGTQMKVYSAQDYSTVDLHFKWMRDYNIDGAFVQRFVSRFKTDGSTRAQNTDRVLAHCRTAAEAYGRAFVVMYDVSDAWSSDSQLYNTITYDWNNRAKSYTNSPNYLFHKGKPLVVVWGMGKDSRWPVSPKVALDIVTFFKTNGCTVMGGVDNDWRLLGSGCRTNVDQGVSWTNVNNAYDVISPWFVGTFSGLAGADLTRNNILVPDIANCNARGVDYMPVVWPGFSWSNWKEGAGNKFNQHPRLGGNYLWRQAYNAKTAAANMLYLAMFDEVDEATALYKTTTTAATSPQVIYTAEYTNRWVTLDIDGQNLPSDWYLQVCDEINRMFKGEKTVVETLPISPNLLPTITSTPVTMVNVGSSYTYTLTATDAETNALSYSSVTLPAWLSFNTNTAVLTGTPSNSDIGFHLVTLRVSDPYGSTSQSFTVWVGAVGNDAPIITSLPHTGVIENQAYSYTISAADVDGDTLTYSAPIKPSWLSFDADTRVLSGTPAPADVGLHLVNLSVYDGTVTVTQQFNVVVFSGAVLPSNLVQNGSFELGGATPTSWTMGANSTRSTENAQNGSWSLKLTTAPGNNRQVVPLQAYTDYQLSVWVHAGGMTSGGIRFDTDDRFDDPTGPNGPGGTCQFTINLGTATTWTQYTGTFNSSTQTSVALRTYQSSMVGTVYFDNVVLKSLNAANVAPVITSVPITHVNQNAAYSYTLLAAHAENDLLVFTGVSIPSWLSFNPNSGLLSGTPTAAVVGSHPVSLRVSDGSLSVTQNFTIAVAPVGYAAWAATNGVGATDADDDHDGRNNLYEYALAGDPMDDTDPGVDPVLVKAGTGLEYVHLRRKDDPDLIYTVETRTNLIFGVWILGGFSVLRTNSYNADYDKIIYGVSPTNPHSYFRLKITKP